MEMRFPHRVKYDADDWTIDQVVLTLQGQRRLIEASTAVLEELIPGLKVESVTIEVNELQTGSLFEDFVIVLYSVYQTDVDGVVSAEVESMFGVSIPEQYQPLLSAILLLIALYVGRYAISAVLAKKGKEPAPLHIQGDYNTVVNMIGSTLNVNAEHVEDALKEAVPPNKRRSLIKSVTSFLRPKPRGEIAAIEVADVARIPKATLDEYPSDSDLEAIDESRHVDIPDARIQIRATDRDKNKSGWAAMILDNKQFKKRLDMVLYPTVDAEALAKCDIVKADISVEGERKPDGSFKGKTIHLLRFEKEK
jgi:hypothetical protein